MLKSRLNHLVARAVLVGAFAEGRAGMKMDLDELNRDICHPEPEPCQSGEYSDEKNKYGPSKAKSSHKQNARASSRKKKRRR